MATAQDDGEAFVRFMCRHLVGLVYQGERKVGAVSKRGTGILSGFVLSLHNQWFWVTAGHCLRYLDQGIRSGDLKILDSGFADYFGSDAAHQHLVPFAYEPGCGFYVDKPSLSVDFGLVPISVLVGRAFQANGVLVVGRENWITQKDLTFSHYKMLGFPECAQELDDGQANRGMRPVMIAVHPIEIPDLPDGGDEWFVGRLDDEAKIPDIGGMSGGPIYGFRNGDKGWAYHVVALQSSWVPQSRVIKGCSLPLFAEEVHQLIAEAMESDSASSG